MGDGPSGATGAPRARDAGPSTADLNLAWSRALVDELVRGGVRHVCVSPGSRSAPLAVAVAERSDLATSVHVDERSAGFFALGHARASGRPAALVCTSGSAGAHYLPAVIEAHMSRVPLVILTADRPPELRETGAWQTIDQAHLFGRFARWFADLPAPTAGLVRYARSVAARAAATAAGRPAGPVHLNVPFREPLVPAGDGGVGRHARSGAPTPGASGFPDASGFPGPAGDAAAVAGRPGGRPWVTVAQTEPTADAATVADLAARIRAHPRGLILAGLTDPPPGYADALARLAAAAGYPILAEPGGGLRFGPHDRAHVVTGYDAFLRAPRWCAAHAPDFVMRFGASFTWRPVAQFLEAHAGAAQIVVDPDGAWDDPTRLAALRVAAAPAALCDAVAAALALAGDGEDAAAAAEDATTRAAWRSAWRAASEAGHAAVEVEVGPVQGRGQSAEGDDDVASRAADGANGAGLDGIAAAPSVEGTVGWVYPTLMAHLPDDALVVAANSMAVRDLDTYTASDPKAIRVIASRGAAGIDGTLSTAIGAAHGSGRPTVLVTGDLAFLHDVNGLAAARMPGPGVLVVVLNDDGGGIFAHLPIAAGALQPGAAAERFARFFRTPTGADLAAACAVHRVPYGKIGAPADLAAAVAALARPSAGVRVVEVPVDMARNTEAHRRLWTAVVERVGG